MVGKLDSKCTNGNIILKNFLRVSQIDSYQNVVLPSLLLNGSLFKTPSGHMC